MTVKDVVDQARVTIELFSEDGVPLPRDACRPALFFLCLAAHRLGRRDPQGPQLTAENLKTFLASQWSGDGEDEDKERLRCLDEACEMWREWWYALDRVND
jgi:hypothetical protein